MFVFSLHGERSVYRVVALRLLDWNTEAVEGVEGAAEGDASEVDCDE